MVGIAPDFKRVFISLIKITKHVTIRVKCVIFQLDCTKIGRRNDKVLTEKLNQINTIGATSGAGTAYPSGAPDFIPGYFGWVRVGCLLSFFVLSYYVSLHSQFRVAMSVTIPIYKRCAVRLYIICVCLRIVVTNTYCVVLFILFVFVLCFVYPLLTVCLDFF